MAIILGAGLMLLVSNIDLPIVRNSFVYGNTAKNIIAYGFNPFPVVADVNLFHGKPIGFALLSSPLVLFFGVNAGLKIASYIGTAFFLCVSFLFFVRLNKRAGIESPYVPLELALLFFNPLVFYQFWSGYPDSIFAGLVLLTFVLMDVIVLDHNRDTRAYILLLGLVIYAAILTRLYGLILGIACPVYLLIHLRSFIKHSIYIKAKIALFVVVFSALGIAVVLAQLGRNPTLNFAIGATIHGGGSGYSGYMTGLMDPSGEVLISSILIFMFAVLLSFNSTLVFLLKTGNGKVWPYAPTCFAGIYLLGLLPFPGTHYNMRFFLPVLAFVVVAIVSGILQTKKATRRRILIVYIALASFLTLNYNFQPVYKGLLTFNNNVLDPVLDRHRRLDNLRIDQHLRFSKAIKRINRLVEPKGVVYWVSNYYGTSTHGMMEDLGIRSDIESRYVLQIDEIPSTKRPFYVDLFGSPSGVADRFAIRPLAPGFFRLVPLKVELVQPIRDVFEIGEPIILRVNLSTSENARILRVEFVVDSLIVATTTMPPFEFEWREASRGRHVLAARLYDTEDNWGISAPKTIFVGIQALERYIARSYDDAEEEPDGLVNVNSSDIELIMDSRRGEQVVGLRFLDIGIPRTTDIQKAYLQFTVDEVNKEQTDLTIHAELASNAASFTEVGHNISSRKLTSAFVKWSPEPWESVGERSMKQRTPDISVIIQEVIAQPNWRAGNAIVFVISGSGKRVAESYNGDKGRMPSLYIEKR